MTQIASKKTFLAWLDRELKDDCAVVLTSQINGVVNYSRKRNSKSVPFTFAADAFRDADSIAHFILGMTPVFGFAICPESELSEEALEKLRREEKECELAGEPRVSSSENGDLSENKTK